MKLSSVATALVASHEEPNIKVQNMKQHTEKLNIKLQSMKQDTEEINNALKIMKEGNEELANKVKFLNDDDKHLCKLFLVDREKMATTNRELLRVSDQENKWLRSRLTTMENQLADVLVSQHSKSNVSSSHADLFPLTSACSRFLRTM